MSKVEVEGQAPIVQATAALALPGAAFPHWPLPALRGVFSPWDRSVFYQLNTRDRDEGYSCVPGHPHPQQPFMCLRDPGTW